jgi:16S rRNA (uracil1498-N3)-methyltransferase
MDIPFFYHPYANIAQGAVLTLDEDTSKHMIQVLRMKEGDPVYLTGGKGNRLHAVISKEHRKASEVTVLQIESSDPPARRLIIAISLLKNANRFEWFLEKATELGVAAIVPMICERTEKEKFRTDRMRSICISAMLQSRQTWLPSLDEPRSFEDAIQTMTGTRLVATCSDSYLKTSIGKIVSDGTILLLIGPEGDFTEKEMQAALHLSFQPVSLGPTRLRTETAGIVGATLLLHH